MSATNSKPGELTAISKAKDLVNHTMWASRERMKRKLRKYKVMYESGAITKEKITESYQSWRSHASHGDCHALIQKYDQLYNEIFERSETADVPIN